MTLGLGHGKRVFRPVTVSENRFMVLKGMTLVTAEINLIKS